MNICSSVKQLPKEIAKKLSEAPVFYSEEYERNVLSRGQVPLYLWSDGRILFARVKKQAFIKAALLESEPYLYDETIAVDEKCFLNSAMESLKKSGVQWTITTNTARFQSYPDGAETILSGNYIIDLTLSEEELWTNVHSKHRNSIRRGEKCEMLFEQGGEELIGRYTSIANETYARSGQSGNSSKYYSSIIKELQYKSLVTMLSKEGVAQAGGVFLYSEAAAYYLHGASISRPEPGSTNYLLWKTIMMMRDKGVKEFSFVGYHVDAEPGSKLDGIQKFKERFGGHLENCYSFKCIHKPIFYKAYCLAMSFKSGNIFKKYKDHIDEQVDKYPELNGKETTK